MRILVSFFLASFILLIYTTALAQPKPSDILGGINFRSIGPTAMSGRISDIEVDPKSQWVIYVATASGGVYKSTGGGVVWTPIFDSSGPGSIGDVEVSDADSSVVWIGTGESNNRNSVGWGDGVYKSVDAGKTWVKVGLENSQQIARIITHPTNKDICWVASIGPLWSVGDERGVFMTVDGGKTWKKTLFVDENTGAMDLAIDSKNPNVLYAGMYERRRFPWTFRSGGKSGGIFKSSDGGKTWKKLEGGLPTGMTGKIGLSVYGKNPNIVYAIIEAEKGAKPEEDKNGVYRTDDAGKTWKRMGTHSTRPFYYHEIMVDPNDDTLVYSMSTNMMRSTDSGKTWRAMPNSIHVDYHAIWVDPNDSNVIWVGNDGGAAVTYDKGVTWKHMSHLVACQFYAIGYDMAVPYWVYGGLQDNQSWGGPTVSRFRQGIPNWEWVNLGGGDGFHVQADWLDNETVYYESQGGAINRRNKRTGENRSIQPRAPQGETPNRFNWSSPIVMSPHNPQIIWMGAQRLYKTVNRGDSWNMVSGDLTTNDPKKLAAMEGLTPERTGAEQHCTIITISESPLKPDVVWVGTDDGLVHFTLNGGVEWTNVTPNWTGVPKNTWVSRVAASKYKPERCYVTFDGHRTGDLKPYVLVTEDMGKTWTTLAGTLPAGSVYVIKEDPVNENLLYLGTEFGLFASLDRGQTWTNWKSNFPSVAVHDLLIHPRERELILGTHGRGIWIAPIEGLQGLNAEGLAANFLIADPIDAYLWVSSMSGGYGDGQGYYWGQNPPFGARIQYYLKQSASSINIEILGADGTVVGTITNPSNKAGVNTVYWNLRQSGAEGRRPGNVTPGTYAIRITIGTETVTKKVTVKPDPTVGRE